jgi:hypothetical protein
MNPRQVLFAKLFRAFLDLNKAMLVPGEITEEQETAAAEALAKIGNEALDEYDRAMRYR